jgi:hypothetical protein
MGPELKDALRNLMNSTKIFVHYLGWNSRYDVSKSPNDASSPPLMYVSFHSSLPGMADAAQNSGGREGRAVQRQPTGAAHPWPIGSTAGCRGPRLVQQPGRHSIADLLAQVEEENALDNNQFLLSEEIGLPVPAPKHLSF